MESLEGQTIYNVQIVAYQAALTVQYVAYEVEVSCMRPT